MTQSLDHYNHNDDEREVIRDHDAFSPTQEENSNVKDTNARHDDIADDHTDSDDKDLPNTQTSRPKTSRPRNRRTPTRSANSKRDATAAKADSSIIKFSDRTTRNGQLHTGAHGELAHDDEELSAIRDLEELKAQGFTSDEAIRLIHVSDRLANGREARESQTTLRRLRFTRWLIEHGVLDEFTA